MEYGITSSEELLDIHAVIASINLYKTAIEDFACCGDIVLTAAETCSEEALSIENSRLQASMKELGTEIKKLKDTFSIHADTVLREAYKELTMQQLELNKYLREQSNKDK